jgi:hypothetical protein
MMYSLVSHVEDAISIFFFPRLAKYALYLPVVRNKDLYPDDLTLPAGFR